MSQTFKTIQSDDGDDWAIDGLGRSVVLTGLDKLNEDLLKILRTEINQFWDAYKTSLNDLIGSNIGLDQTKKVLATRITDSLVYLQTLQNDQRKYQVVTADELIASIDSVAVSYLGEVTGHNEDLFTYQVDIKVTNGVGQQTNVNHNYSLSGS